MFGNAEKEWVNPKGVGALPCGFVKVRLINGVRVVAELFDPRDGEMLA